MIKNKYVIDDFGNGEVVQKSPDAFEKQKQIAAKRKKQRSATQPPARTSGNTTTAKTPKTVGITGATGPEHERSYTVTGLNSSDAVYREQMKTSTAASAPPAKTNTSLQPAANTKPADVPQPQATPAPAPGRGNSMTSKLHLTEEDTARLLAEAREELAAEGLSGGSKKTKKQQSADPESIDPETLLPDWFETKYPEWTARVKAVGKQAVEAASQAAGSIGQRLREVWNKPVYTEADLIPYTSVEDSEYWEIMQQGEAARKQREDSFGLFENQQALHDEAYDLIQRYKRGEVDKLTPQEEQWLMDAFNFNVRLGDPESLAAWEAWLAQEGARMNALEAQIEAGEKAERQARIAGYYFEPTEREKSEERLAKYRGDPKAWELTRPDVDAPQNDWLAWEKEVKTQKTAMEAERDELIGLYEYAKQHGDKETMERIEAKVGEMNREIKHMGFTLNIMNEDFAENSQVNEDYSQNVLYYMVNRKNLPYEKNPIRGFEDQVIAPPGGYEMFGEMSDLQVAYYNYLFDEDMQNGTNTAGQYLAMIEPGLLYQQAVEQEEAFKKLAEEAPGLAAFLAPLYSVGKAKVPLVAGTAALMGTELSPYDPAFNEMRAQQTLQETVAAQLPEWAQMPYNVANGIVEDVATTWVGGKAVGALLQAVSSGIDSYYDVLERGGSGGQAVGAGTVGSIAEIISNLGSEALKTQKSNSSFVSSVRTNFTESATAPIANTIWDIYSMKDNSLWNRSIEETGSTDRIVRDLGEQVLIGTIAGSLGDALDSRNSIKHMDVQRTDLPESRKDRIRIIDKNDPTYAKYSRSIEKYQNLLESRDTLLLHLHRAQMSGDQAKIKEYTKGLNTLNKEILYQENHNPMLEEALKVQETLFNQQNK